MDVNVVSNVADLYLTDNVGNKFFTKFSDYGESTLFFLYWSNSENDQKQIVNLYNEQDENPENNFPIYFHFAKTILNKKDTTTKILVKPSIICRKHLKQIKMCSRL
jgi:hypothetical protein